MPYATTMTRWLTTTSLLACLAGGFTTVAPAGEQSPAGQEETALDRYVRMPDPNYEYSLEHYVDGDGYRAFVLNMV